MQVTGKVTVQFTRPAILHITLYMILPAIPLVISDITCPVVQHIVTGVLFQGFGDSPSEQLRLTHCGTVPIRLGLASPTSGIGRGPGLCSPRTRALEH